MYEKVSPRLNPRPRIPRDVRENRISLLRSLIQIFSKVPKEESVEYYTNYRTGSQKAISIIRQAKV